MAYKSSPLRVKLRVTAVVAPAEQVAEHSPAAVLRVTNAGVDDFNGLYICHGRSPVTGKLKFEKVNLDGSIFRDANGYKKEILTWMKSDNAEDGYQENTIDNIYKIVTVSRGQRGSG